MGATLGQVGNPAGSVCVSELRWPGNSQDKPPAHRGHLPCCWGWSSLQPSGHKICKLQNMETLSSAEPKEPHFPITVASPFCRLLACNGLL